MLSGKELIFIVSLPRSGSTLLQYIMGGHSEVCTTAEPWLFFPTSYMLKQGSLMAEYQPDVALVGFSDFLNGLKRGKSVFYEALNEFASHFYIEYLTQSGKQFFLDKTSRNYLIIADLARVFPKAKFIFLIRNPVSVLISYAKTMAKDNVLNLGNPGIREDLLFGYGKIFEGQKEVADDQKVFVKYENLVSSPATEIQKLCSFIGIEFQESMLNYERIKSQISGRLIDPKSIHRHSVAVGDYKMNIEMIGDNDQLKLLILSYLDYLDSKTLSCLGYSTHDLKCDISFVKKKYMMLDFNSLMFPTVRDREVNKLKTKFNQRRWKSLAYLFFKSKLTVRIRFLLASLGLSSA